MKLRDWIRATPPKKRAEICAQMNTTPDYLWQIAGGHSRPSAKLAKIIEQHTGVARHELLPEVFDPPAQAILQESA